MITDSHAHLTSPELLPNLEEILARAKEKKIDKVVNICTDEASLQEGILLRKRCPWVYNAAATTPHDVEKEGGSFFPLVAQAAGAGELIAIGETGLDYFYEHSDRNVQQKYLLQYFTLARDSGLPLIFHCRDAFSDLFRLANVHYRDCPALLHCFTGTKEEAQGVCERGWYLSISGIVTFKKSVALAAVAKQVPLDRLLVETDAPYLAPQSKRGQQNEPSYLVETVAFLAELLGMQAEELGKITSANAERFFSFSKVKS